MVERHLLKLAGTGPHPKPGRDAVTVEDVQVAVSYIGESHIAAMMYAIYGLDESGVPTIATALVRQFRPVRRWRTGTRAKLARQAIEEFLNPDVCPNCGGTGKVLARTVGEGVLEVTCDPCDGRGIKRQSLRRRARRFGISHQAWREQYDQVYQEFLFQLDQWRLEGMRYVKRQL